MIKVHYALAGKCPNETHYFVQLIYAKAKTKTRASPRVVYLCVLSHEQNDILGRAHQSRTPPIWVPL
jgi:hypothetical protein